jgi:hypothetical protein
MMVAITVGQALRVGALSACSSELCSTAVMVRQYVIPRLMISNVSGICLCLSQSMQMKGNSECRNRSMHMT